MTFALSVISLFFLIFTSIFGIYCLVELLSKKLFDEKNEKIGIHIIKAWGDAQKLEWEIRQANKIAQMIVVLDLGLSDEGIAIAKKMEQEKGNTKLATPTELLPLISDQN